jgi:tetratricopeptide (TPR) repeat protein
LTEAQIELETSIAVDPNDTFSLRNLGSTLVQMGRPEAAIPYIEKSIRLSPHDPFIAANYSWLGMCHTLLGHPDQASELLRKAWTANPRHASYRFWLAGALGLKGDLYDAKAAIAEAIKLSPEIDTIERFRASTPFAADPAYRALRDKTLEAGLRPER